MRLTLKQLKSRVVETVSGAPLGRIADCVIQWDSQSVVQYVVKPSILRGEKLLLAPNQIVRLEEKKIIVQDSVRDAAAAPLGQKPVGVSPEPVAMRKDG